MPVTIPTLTPDPSIGLGKGLVSFDIRWDKPTVAKFQRMIGRNGVFGGLNNWQNFFKSLKQSGDIQNNIAKNIDLKQTPDGFPWAGLSGAYARQVGRTQMEIPHGLNSPIWAAYVLTPRITWGKTSLKYTPDEARFPTKRYDLALRFGWMGSKGGIAPGREWFGISSELHDDIVNRMETYVNNKLASIFGGKRT